MQQDTSFQTSSTTVSSTTFPICMHNCVKFPDCGWLAVREVPPSVVGPDVRDVTVEVEYYWLNPGRDGWIIIRSNGEGGSEQVLGNDINTHKDFFKANQWATWTLRLTNAHFGSRADKTDLLFYFGADPDDICYIRSIKVYATATPENYAVFGAAELQSHATPLNLNACNKQEGYVTFDVRTYTPSPNGVQLPAGTHSGIEVIYGNSDGSVVIDQQVIPYHAGDILFVNPDQLRSVNVDLTGSCFYMVFDLSALESHFRNSIITDIRLNKKRLKNLVPKQHPLHSKIKPLCQQLFLHYGDPSPYNEMKVQSLLLDLLYQCCENGWIEDVPHSDKPLLNQLRQVIGFMEEHLSEPLTIRDLAGQIHLSEAYFSRQFKSCMGVTPMEHLTRLRLEKACQLLLSGLSVTDTAMEVGIPHVGHFIRVFKKRYGVTPYQWAKRQSVI